MTFAINGQRNSPTYRALNLNPNARHRPLTDVIICVTNWDARTTLDRLNLWHTSRHSKRISPEPARSVLTVKPQVITYVYFEFICFYVLRLCYIKTGQLMLCREIISVCCQIHTKHINTLCGQKVELLNVKRVVHIVTTGL